MIQKFTYLISIAVFSLAQLSGRAAEAVSDPSIVWTDPSGSIIWKTITEMPVPVSIDWPKDAASAHLTVMAGSTALVDEMLTDTSVRTYQASFSLPLDETEECILEFSLVFANGAGTPLTGETRTMRIGCVRGTCGKSFRCIPQGSACNKWKSVKTGTAVVPVPEDTVSLALDGRPLDYGSAPGWAYFAGLAAGEHKLEKPDTSGGLMEAILFVSGGFLLMLK